MTDLLTLAARVEAAQGPNWRLDREIAQACTGYHPMSGEDAPRFTASLDAAETLVPEGSRWAVGQPFEQPSFAACDPPEPSKAQILCEAVTPALALCAAALRARASAGGEAR